MEELRQIHEKTMHTRRPRWMAWERSCKTRPHKKQPDQSHTGAVPSEVL